MYERDVKDGKHLGEVGRLVIWEEHAEHRFDVELVDPIKELVDALRNSIVDVPKPPDQPLQDLSCRGLQYKRPQESQELLDHRVELGVVFCRLQCSIHISRRRREQRLLKRSQPSV
jgi:hypothetical protein